MRIHYEDLALPVSQKLAEQLCEFVQKHGQPETCNSITLNFRDPKYSAEAGGFRPVEIRLEQQGDNVWSICYITEFTYVGLGPFAELEKSVDFDFQAGMYQDLHGYHPIEIARSLYPIWEDNFLTYWLGMGVYEVEVS
ncbi:MAG: DUF2787 domain-containing protein [Idiomarina sp.]|nr:DUF2787 domain-containing protein [Idiomarina sp.]